MIEKHAETYQPEHTAGPDRSLHVFLWTLWTLAVVGTAFFRWRADVAVDQPVDLLGLVIYSFLAGLIGLLVITIIELRMEPNRFLD